MKNFDIVVVGGGLVGAAFVLDLALQNPKLEIGVFEKRPAQLINLSDKLDNKIYAISPHNLKYLAKIGGLPNENKMGIIQKMDIFGDGKSNLLFDAKLAKQFFLAKTVEYSYLHNYLYEKLNDLINVHFIYGQINSIEVTSHCASLTCDNNLYTAQLVVGSDGANSVVREYAGVDTQNIIYEQGGIVANFECEVPHKNIAYQWFNLSNILAYLPLPGNRISIVWAHPGYQDIINLDNTNLSDKVAAAGKYKLGKLRLITPAAVFPLRLNMVKKLYAKRIVLIGDAAHTLHPLAGQGVNLGFEDANELASILAMVSNYQLGDESLLARYNAKRLPAIRQMQLTCHAFHNIFNTNGLPITYIRNMVLNLVNHFSEIKKHLIYRVI
ncbi:MAG: UbiH/UbiF family hydroxylase [Burkholderiales bacterium]|nr:UbiH/UbiF family hydroxylase [Burkholderiales bacterium]